MNLLVQQTSTLKLDGPRTSIVFAWTNGVPSVIYHGKILRDDTDLDTLVAICARPLPQATIDENDPISLHPELGRGFLGHPALIGKREASSAPGWAGRFSYVGNVALDDGIVFQLSDPERGLSLEIECRIDASTDVATFVSRLTNDADSQFEVDWLSAPVVAPSQQFSQHLSFHGRWCAEFSIERQPIPLGLTKRENRRGRTSHEAFPGIILVDDTTGEDSGPCLGIHLGWSGNHRMVLERLSTGDVQIQMGVLLFAGEKSLMPGQSVETPPLYVAYSSSGLNAMSHKLHQHVRANIVKFPDPTAPRPVTVNTWEALYFDHKWDKLTKLVDCAAKIGAERFVLDDGWFRGRNDDSSGLGDWYTDESKYPEGLQPLADYVRSAGMAFGLWVEPEMVNQSSRLFQEHPDWVLGLGNYPKLTGRNQLVLDIAKAPVAEYLYQRLSSLIDQHGISYLKWDMNRDLVLPGDSRGRATVYRQTGALYDLLNRLTSAFPGLEIESCASGGGRVDYGILAHTHRFWASDSNDAVERMRIQNGFSYFFPPEVMGSHIGPAWCHTSGRGFHAGFRALVASYGHMGVEADLTAMSDADIAVVKNAVARHKADRHIWHAGRFYRVKTVDPCLFGALAVSADKNNARLLLTQTDRPRSTVPPRILVPGLEPDRDYRVILQAESEMVSRANRRFDNPLVGDGFVASGASLEAVGIGLPSLYAQTGLAIAIDTVENAA